MCCWHCFRLSFSEHLSPLRISFTGNAAETGLALLLLFVFALFASGYVLKEGLRKKEKTTHELLLKCVIIITSVVPRQLPMQV
jgi:cation-transporting ATPase 13A1